MLAAEEIDWVCKAQAADREAFSLLVDRYWERLARWFYGITARRDMAEDLTQETFLRAWVALPRLQTVAAFRVWLFRIAHHCFLSQLRRSGREACTDLEITLPISEPAPLAALIDAEGQQMLVDALGRLAVTFRVAYLLWTQEEMPYSKMAEVLVITETTARWRVYKARQFLAKELQGYLDLATC
jgi:RNA polymerase sigma factor (sigma-70 family)